MGSKVFFSFLLLLLLLFTTEEGLSGNDMVVRVEARKCQTQSEGFQGPCWSSRYCREACRIEGYNGGRCGGILGQCLCSWPCA